MHKAIALIVASSVAGLIVPVSACSSSSNVAPGADDASSDGQVSPDGTSGVCPPNAGAGGACSPEGASCTIACGEGAVCTGGHWGVYELPCTDGAPPEDSPPNDPRCNGAMCGAACAPLGLTCRTRPPYCQSDVVMQCTPRDGGAAIEAGADASDGGSGEWSCRPCGA